MPAIEVTGLQRAFSEEVLAVAGIDLHVDDGEIYPFLETSDRVLRPLNYGTHDVPDRMLRDFESGFARRLLLAATLVPWITSTSAAEAERVLVVMAENLSQLTPAEDLRMLLTVGDGAAGFAACTGVGLAAGLVACRFEGFLGFFGWACAAVGIRRAPSSSSARRPCTRAQG